MVSPPIKGLEWKCIISAVTDYEDWATDEDLRIPYVDLKDPQAELFGDYQLKGLGTGSGGGSDFAVVNSDDFGKLAHPNHYQDRIHRLVIDKAARGGSVQNDMEFELDVESITHTWQGLTSPMDLPMLNPITDDLGADVGRNVQGGVIYQMNALAMDLGMSKEQITIKGLIIDRDNPPHQTATGAPHIRRQQLMDIARGQWAGVGRLGSTDTGKTDMMSPNAWVGLTLGRAHRRTQQVAGTSHEDEVRSGTFFADGTWVETLWFGDEPSDDVRGKERMRTDDSVTPSSFGSGRPAATFGMYYDGSASPKWVSTKVNRSPSEFEGIDAGINFFEDKPNGFKDGVSSESRVLRDWDFKFHYDGRNRYRGVISDLSLSHAAGRPDVWDYSMTFQIVKNETQIRHLE